MTVETLRHDGWAEVVLSRPERKNAITGPLGVALAGVLNELANDDDVQLVMLRGAGARSARAWISRSSMPTRRRRG